MPLKKEDLIIEISSGGCVDPNSYCHCCKKFGYHRAKVTHKPTGLSSEITQIVREIYHHEKSNKEAANGIEDPKILAINKLEIDLKDKQEELEVLQAASNALNRLADICRMKGIKMKNNPIN